jgi:protein-L-isoaspartate(D-aspartate) O-methyltransferase
MTVKYLKPEIACEKLIKTLRGKGIHDENVLDAFRKVPRHLFVDEALFEQSYDDNALPIGQGQTISQPYIVALMTQLLQLEKGANEKILEIGTGSGFQAAILAQFTPRVYTIERNRELSEKARKKLRGMGYENIVFKVGDGTLGWPQHAPFDRIIVTAGAPAVPRQLTDQLAVGGTLLIPAGDRSGQQLEVFRKNTNGVEKNNAGGVIFVPLIGSNGWKEEG